METTQHQKHAKLKRREQDNFATNEIAILGVKCSIIADFVQKIVKKMQKTSKIAYYDASHDEGLLAPALDEFVSHQAGSIKVNMSSQNNAYNERIRLANYDLLFINGNHFKGAKQILILDPEKEASVKKRLEQLDRVQFIITLDNETKLFDFLLERYPNIKNLKRYHINELDKIARHLDNLVAERIAPVQGLVLAGGKSKRMGQDKTQLEYHGKPQKEWLVELLEDSLLNTFVSVAIDDRTEDDRIIQDKFVGLGAFGAICSAFQQDPNKAWLVLAVDLPFVTRDLIQQLLRNRNPAKMATAIKGKSKEFVEPLITIYEPKAYPILLSYLSQGYACPRKALINSEVEIVTVDDALIRNVNTPEEYNDVLGEIGA